MAFVIYGIWKTRLEIDSDKPSWTIKWSSTTIIIETLGCLRIWNNFGIKGI